MSDLRPMTPEMLYEQIDALRQENGRLLLSHDAHELRANAAEAEVEWLKHNQELSDGGNADEIHLLKREVERLRELLRDSLIDHPDECECRYCEAVFRRVALGEE